MPLTVHKVAATRLLNKILDANEKFSKEETDRFKGHLVDLFTEFSASEEKLTVDVTTGPHVLLRASIKQLLVQMADCSQKIYESMVSCAMPYIEGINMTLGVLGNLPSQFSHSKYRIDLLAVDKVVMSLGIAFRNTLFKVVEGSCQEIARYRGLRSAADRIHLTIIHVQRVHAAKLAAETDMSKLILSFAEIDDKLALVIEDVPFPPQLCLEIEKFRCRFTIDDEAKPLMLQKVQELKEAAKLCYTAAVDSTSLVDEVDVTNAAEITDATMTDEEKTARKIRCATQKGFKDSTHQVNKLARWAEDPALIAKMQERYQPLAVVIREAEVFEFIRHQVADGSADTEVFCHSWPLEEITKAFLQIVANTHETLEAGEFFLGKESCQLAVKWVISQKDMWEAAVSARHSLIHGGLTTKLEVLLAATEALGDSSPSSMADAVKTASDQVQVDLPEARIIMRIIPTLIEKEVDACDKAVVAAVTRSVQWAVSQILARANIMDPKLGKAHHASLRKLYSMKIDAVEPCPVGAECLSDIKKVLAVKDAEDDSTPAPKKVLKVVPKVVAVAGVVLLLPRSRGRLNERYLTVPVLCTAFWLV